MCEMFSNMITEPAHKTAAESAAVVPAKLINVFLLRVVNNQAIYNISHSDADQVKNYSEKSVERKVWVTNLSQSAYIRWL